MKNSKRLQVVIAVSLLFALMLTALPSAPQAVLAAESEKPLGRVYVQPSINKKFVPSVIAPGQISRLTVYLYNPNEYQLINTAFTDEMGQYLGANNHSEIILADDPLAVTTCGGSVTAVPGATSFGLSGGTIPAKVGAVNGQCTVSVNVTGFSDGNWDNRIPVGALTAQDIPEDLDPVHNFQNETDVQETLNIADLSNPDVNKSFQTNPVWVGQRTRLGITIRNTDSTYALHDAALTDTLPANMQVASPASVSTSNCGSSVAVDADPGDTSIQITGADINKATTCTVYVYVIATVENDLYTNTIAGNSLTTYERVTDPNPASSNLTVRGLRPTKVFSPDVILAGEDTSTLTITIQNPYTTALTSAEIADTLPGQLVYIPGTETSTCGSPTLTLSNSDQTLTMTGGTIPTGSETNGVVTVGTCTITVDVEAPVSAAGGLFTNTVPADTLTAYDGATPYTNAYSFSDNIRVNPQSIAVSKTYSPTRLEVNGTATLFITLTNPTSRNFTGVDLTDNMPANMVPLASPSPTTTCGGTVSIDTTADPDTVTLTGGTIPANGSCYFEVPVQMTNTGTIENCIPADAIETTVGVTNQDEACRSIIVYPTNQGVVATKNYNTNNVIASDANFYVTLTFRAPEDEALSGVGITDALPSGVTITNSSGPIISNCGSVYTTSIPVGGDTIQLDDVEIIPGVACSVRVYLTADEPGTYLNVMYPIDFTNPSGQTFPSPVQDTITVSDFWIQKSFSHSPITRGGKTILTVTLHNDNVEPIITGSVTDRFDTMGNDEFLIADPANFSTTCPAGTTASGPGDDRLIFTGLQMDGDSSCTFTVTLEAQNIATIGRNRNAIAITDASVAWNNIPGTHNPRANSTADVYIEDMDIDLVKRFDPSAVFGGSPSRMTITLINPNNVRLENITFTDTMPTGMVITNPMNIDTSTCGGTVTVAGDRQSFIYSGGILSPNRQCTVQINATLTVNNNLVNTIPAGAVSTFRGVTNPFPASSTLTNLPGVSVKKFFTPNEVKINEVSILTLEFANSSDSAPVTNMGLYDSFPTGLLIAAAPAPTNTCGGTFTAVAGASAVELVGGYLAKFEDTTDPLGSDVCQVTLPVYAENPGTYKNTIPDNAITADDGVTNILPTEDTLIVEGTPALEIVKNVTSAGPYVEGDTITYEIIATNTGDIPVNNVQIVDADAVVDPLSCTPALGSTLDVAETMTCSASHVVTADDVLALEFVNTASADSDETEPVSDNERVILAGGPDMTISKGTTSTGPYYLGDTITYQIVVRNTGTITLNNVQVTDPGTDVTLGTCTPVLGSSLALGASMTCSATHVVTQVDVDAANFSNTAIGDSDETPPVDDTVDVPIANFPVLGVYKFQASSGPYAVGDTITYTIAAKNEGNTTLTGVTITDTGTEAALGPCVINENPAVVTLPTSLAPDDILYCEAYHEVVQADIDAAEYTNTAVGDSNETSPEDGSVTVPLTQIPIITLVKSGTLHDDVVAPSGRVDEGDTITYTFRVENTGNVTLSNVDITDAVAGVVVSGGPITMSPGDLDTGTFTATYTITQADVDAGTFTNTATVTGRTPQNSPVTDDDDDTKNFTQSPSIELVKTGSLDITSTAPVGEANPGDVISYTFTVTNTGNVTLTDITLSDTFGGVTITGGPIVSLDPGDSDNLTFTGSYTLTQPDIDAGNFYNEAEVTGTPPIGDDVTDDDDHDETIPQNPGIELVKSGALDMTVIAPNTRADVGDVINYTFTVTNTGNVTLSDVTISDTVGGVTISGDPISLDPGDSDTLTFTGSYTLTQPDIDTGNFYNEAEVTGTPPIGDDVTDDDDHDEPITQEPSIELEKTGALDMTVIAPNTRADVGDVIDYTFTVTNTGNVTLTDITISDTVGGVTISGGQIASLDPGSSDNTTITGSYTLTQHDIDAGNFYNEAQVTGTPPVGDDVTDDDDHDETITPAPSISLVKTGTLDMTVVAPDGEPNPGDVITYAFTVTNTGNVTLTNVTLADTVGGVTISGGPITSMAPGDSDTLTFTGSYTLTQPDIDAGNFYNEAEVTGTPPVGDDVTDDDDHDEPLDRNPAISLLKTGTLDNSVVAPNTRTDEGDQINYAFTVTNTGNTTLTNIAITDLVGGVTISGTIASLAPGTSDNTSITGVYTLTQPDVDTGSFYNQAEVEADEPGGGTVTDDDDDLQNFTPEPSITLEKTGTIDDTVAAPAGRVDEGDQINYVFAVTNTGNVTLSNVTVTDTVGGVIVTGTIASLAPGATDNTSITGVYTITQADIDAGDFHNEATVEGTDPNTTVVDDDDDDDQTFTQDPSIRLEKTGTLNMDIIDPDTRADEGDTITYAFTVTNTGNVTLYDIDVTDANPGVTITGTTIAELAPGDSSAVFTGSYTLTLDDINAGTFTNTATVSGDDPDSEEVTDDDDDQQDLDSVPSISIEKTGTLDETIVPLNTRPDEGDVINYAFRVENTGNTTLYNIVVTDTIGGVTITGGPIVSLDPGEVDDTTYTGSYTLTLGDVNSGSFYNEATVTGTDPHSTPVEDDDDDTQSLVDDGTLGIAKRVFAGPTEFSPGTWHFTYQLYIENAGNVTLTDVQVTDDLESMFGSMVFSVLEVRSTEFTLNPAYDGIPSGDINLLDGTDVLDPGDYGYIEIDVELIPENGGPFDNTAVVTGTNPSDEEVTDDSQDGINPDPDGDDDPTNNNEPTPLDFGPNLFDPPFGIKTFDNAGLPLLQWNMVWINDSNIVSILAQVSDPIPLNSRFYDDGIPSGYPLPAGPHPSDTTTNGVVCGPEDGYTGTGTTTTYCYYEGPTIEYPRGRIIWEGTLGPDLGATNADEADDELYISFHVRVINRLQNVYNVAEIGTDLDGDGDIEGDEVVVAEASDRWLAELLPDTGFAPGEITILPEQPFAKQYTSSGITVEIPSLDVSAEIVTVPFEDGTWDVTWLGDSVGYLEGSAYPTWNGNTVLTAHNWTPLDQPGVFVDINRLSYGDKIIVHAFGMTYTYAVRSQSLVNAAALDAVFEHEELDWVTLMTCFGYNETTGEYRYRRIVRAVLVDVQ